MQNPDSLRLMRGTRRILVRMFLAPILATGACGSDTSDRLKDSSDRQPDPALAPVTDTNAITVADLDRQGFLIVDQREAGCDAGPGVHCDGFSALYFGGGNEAGKDAVAEYACPGTKAPVDQWKCRRLDPPYVPNGGFKPAAKGGN